MYIFKLKLSEKARGYCMYVLLVNFGYRIPFVSTPLAKRFSNNKSALAHHDFVTNAILELVANSAIVEVPSVPLVVSPL